MGLRDSRCFPLKSSCSLTLSRLSATVNNKDGPSAGHMWLPCAVLASSQKHDDKRSPQFRMVRASIDLGRMWISDEPDPHNEIPEPRALRSPHGAWPILPRSRVMGLLWSE